MVQYKHIIIELELKVCMVFRKTTVEDISSVLEIICQAQQYLKQKNINQWQNGYPNETSILEDIEKEYSYVMEANGVVIGTIAIVFTGEPTYKHIYEGNWKTDGTSYVTLHRVAVHNDWKGQGIAGIMIEKVIAMCEKCKIKSIRIDTHRENFSMQNMMKKNGFDYCGVIYLEDGEERLAFERKL